MIPAGMEAALHATPALQSKDNHAIQIKQKDVLHESKGISAMHHVVDGDDHESWHASLLSS